MKRIVTLISVLVLITWAVELRSGFGQRQLPNYQGGSSGTPPLVMEGGDPYIRALMRTIAASEANDPQPYTLLYGGKRIWDLSRHPEHCVTIVAGPNKGNCTTAAGRYQFINTTWHEKAMRYHPGPSGFWFWKNYSFEAQYQDAVVYAWLSDPQAWGMDISQKLQQGKLDEVLRKLSGTWTSLGYGIEDNVVTKKLPKIYQRLLQEELQGK
ncbi:MAG: glycoside hydrolase family protein [Symploca sp. SIO1B1]|nr:glycoside hydrolase family protein [Symploca sp. SIO1B1]